MSVCIASCVFLSNFASFLSRSRFRSQFGRFGAMLCKSCTQKLSYYFRGTIGSTHKLLGSPFRVLFHDFLRQSFDFLLYGLHLDIFV